jgi:hypothetical protein
MEMSRLEAGAGSASVVLPPPQPPNGAVESEVRTGPPPDAGAEQPDDSAPPPFGSDVGGVSKSPLCFAAWDTQSDVNLVVQDASGIRGTQVVSLSTSGGPVRAALEGKSRPRRHDEEEVNAMSSCQRCLCGPT